MNSFDVFDTLIARRYLTSIPIFEQISREFNIDNFVERRIKADTGLCDIDSIYESMGIGKEVMAREIFLEHEHSFPIQENIDRVAHGDLLISDMYLPTCYILSLLRHSGLDKQVTVYSSNGGKSSGDVWKRIRGKAPALHLGDNRLSDFDMPTSLGINCQLFEKSGLTHNENSLISAGLPSVGYLMREVRLRSTPTSHPHLSEISGQLNLPCLFIAAELLNRRYDKQKVFLGRDSQQLYYIYNSYFNPAFYLPFSRKIAYAQPQASIAYLKSHIPKNALLVDIQSTGATWEKLQAGVDVAVLIYIDNYKYTQEQPVPPKYFSYLIKSSECPPHVFLERINCANHGYISEIDVYDDTLFRAVFAECEFPTKDVINSIHGCVKMALGLTQYYRENIRRELGAIDEKILIELLKTVLQAIISANGIIALYPDWESSENSYNPFAA
jgi:hypothetical protein